MVLIEQHKGQRKMGMENLGGKIVWFTHILTGSFFINDIIIMSGDTVYLNMTNQQGIWVTSMERSAFRNPF